jgi:glyoxylase-like metal-dependent hydrolase (beta-lactamase superfamily II)
MNVVNVGYKSTNYYVLADSQPRLLVDAGWPGTLGQFQGVCRRAGVELASIPYVLATHYHPDHAGLAQELKRIGLRLIVVDIQAAAIPLLRAQVKPTDKYVDITLNDNVRVTVDDSRAFLASIGIPGQILATPGHSDDSVTLLLDDGSAFTGDLTAPQMAEGEALASWEKLRSLGAKTVYPGHGPVGVGLK